MLIYAYNISIYFCFFIIYHAYIKIFKRSVARPLGVYI